MIVELTSLSLEACLKQRNVGFYYILTHNLPSTFEEVGRISIRARGLVTVKGEQRSFHFLRFHEKGKKASVLLGKGEIENPYNLCHQLSFLSGVTTKKMLEKGDSLLTNSSMVF